MTAGVITSAASIMVVVFAVFVGLKFVFIQQLGLAEQPFGHGADLRLEAAPPRAGSLRTRSAAMRPRPPSARCLHDGLRA
mgnify:CR=1 FL=1